jgi:hypothetical protein
LDFQKIRQAAAIANRPPPGTFSDEREYDKRLIPVSLPAIPMVGGHYSPGVIGGILRH